MTRYLESSDLTKELLDLVKSGDLDLGTENLGTPVYGWPPGRWAYDPRVLDIVELIGFPAIRVSEGSFPRPEVEFWTDLYDDPEKKQRIEKAAAATGQVRYGRYEKEIGTAFLVRPDLAVTVRHSALRYADEDGTGLADFLVDRRTGTPLPVHLDMLDETPGDPSFEVAVTEPLWIEPDPTGDAPDFALLKVEPGHGIEPLELAPAPAYPDQRIVVVGYPGSSESYLPQNPEVFQNYFGGVPRVKRVSPGWVMNDALWGYPWQFWTNATTYPGSSGSPIVDVETGQVTGVHHGGIYKVGNFAVHSQVVSDRIEHLVNAGLLDP